MATQSTVEDIDSIMSRFQAWAGKQPGSSSKDGVREISYDEAVRANRYRAVVADDTFANATAPVAPTATMHAAKATSSVTEDGIRNDPASRPAAEMHFRKVMEQSGAFAQKTSAVLLPVKPQASSVAMARRPTSISVRVSPAEHASIRAQADEANLSVSAYLRQCALEVEQLRSQVQMMAEQQARPGTGFAPGFLGQLLGRITKRILGPGSADRLSLYR